MTSSELLNPFSPKYQARYVTSSAMKIDFAQRMNIPTDSSAEKVDRVTMGEGSLDQEIGDQVIITDPDSDYPYPVRVAANKARFLLELIRDSESDEINYIVSDVVWKVRPSQSQHHFLNKPQGDPNREQTLIELYDSSRGKIVSSDSGIALINSKSGKVLLFYTSLTLGIIKIDLNLELLHSSMREHPNFSSGLSLEFMLEHVLKPRKRFRFKVKSLIVDEQNGSIANTNEQASLIPYNQENYLLYKTIAIGIIPPFLFP